MTKNELLLKEYENLRDEIVKADSLNYQILGLIVGAVGVILTTAISQPDPLTRLFVFMCVYVVTIPGYRLLQGNRRRIWRISTYLRVFLEPELEFIKWETRLDLQRKSAKTESGKQFFSSLVSTNEWYITSMMNILAALGAIFGGLLQMQIETGILILGVVAVVSIILWLLTATARQEKMIRRLGEIEQGYLQSWLEIKNTDAG